jgi:hypothetical protein
MDSFMPKVTLTYESVVECDLDLKAIKKYLESKKWRDTGSYGRFGRYFESAEYGETVTLPTTDRIADFNARIAELVRTLAWCGNGRCRKFSLTSDNQTAARAVSGNHYRTMNSG